MAAFGFPKFCVHGSVVTRLARGPCKTLWRQKTARHLNHRRLSPRRITRPCDPASCLSPTGFCAVLDQPARAPGCTASRTLITEVCGAGRGLFGAVRENQLRPALAESCRGGGKKRRTWQSRQTIPRQTSHRIRASPFPEPGAMLRRISRSTRRPAPSQWQPTKSWTSR